MALNKVVANAHEALNGIADNMTLMVGGFGLWDSRKLYCRIG